MPTQWPKLFEDMVGKPCAEYIACRDHEGKQEARDALEDAWSRFGHLCPEGREFRRHFQIEFHSRSWELWLTAVLADGGATLRRPPPKGPDILMETAAGARVWIEAIVPGPGEGDDAAWQRPHGARGFRGPGEEQVMLRYLSAVDAKRRKIEGYRDQGIVAQNEACLIAVSQGGILDADLLDLELPTVARAVLGIGPTTIVVPVDSEERPHVEVPARDHVTKKNTSPVSTVVFLDGQATAVAGILFASDVVWNLTWDANRSLRLLHNPTATIAVARGSIPTSCELWVEDGSLRHRGRCARLGHYAAAPPRQQVD